MRYVGTLEWSSRTLVEDGRSLESTLTYLANTQSITHVVECGILRCLGGEVYIVKRVKNCF